LKKGIGEDFAFRIRGGDRDGNGLDRLEHDGMSVCVVVARVKQSRGILSEELYVNMKILAWEGEIFLVETVIM
jgi:hypothetical protein